MQKDADAVFFEAAFEVERGGLAVKSCDDDSRDVDVAVAEVIDESEGVVVVGDAEVCADFLAFDIACMDTDNDVSIGCKILQQTHFDIWIEAWEDACGVEVADEFAAKFQIKPLS